MDRNGEQAGAGWEVIIPGVTPMFLSRFSSTMDRLFLPSSAIRSRSLAGSIKPPPPMPPPPSRSSPPFCKCSMLGLLEDVDKLCTELDRDGTAGKMKKVRLRVRVASAAHGRSNLPSEEDDVASWCGGGAR